jgi:hypothetical protein
VRAEGDSSTCVFASGWAAAAPRSVGVLLTMLHIEFQRDANLELFV